MERSSVILVLGLMMALSVITSLTSGEDTPVSLITVSANESTVSSEGNGTYLVQLNGVNPNATVSDTNRTITTSLEKVIPKDPCTAVIVLSGSEGKETAWLGQVSNPIYSSDNVTMVWTIISQRYYDGTVLKKFQENATEIQQGEYNATSLYLEYAIPDLENTCPMSCTKYGCSCN